MPPGPAYLYVAGKPKGWYLQEQKIGATLTVAEGQPRTVTLKLDPKAAVEGAAVAIEGTAVDAGGRPVSGAQIYRAWGAKAICVTASDDRGRFRVVGFKPDEEVTLRALKDDLGTREWPTARASETKPPQVLLELRPFDGGSLVGRVVDEGGLPVPNASIHAAGERGSERQGVGAEHSFIFTDAEGRYEVRGIWAGWRYTVSASKMGWRSDSGPPVVAQAGAANNVPDLVLIRER